MNKWKGKDEEDEEKREYPLNHLKKPAPQKKKRENKKVERKGSSVEKRMLKTPAVLDLPRSHWLIAEGRETWNKENTSCDYLLLFLFYLTNRYS